MQLDPRRVLTFREVARQGSFSLAAETLALSQPAVSQQVASLERSLGARLLRRGRGAGGLALTEAGRTLLAHADALAERLALAETQLGEQLEAADRRVRLGAFPSALATLVPAALARVLADDPAVEAEVAEGPADVVTAGVRDGGLHLGVCYEDPSDPVDSGGLERRELLREPMYAAVPSGHPLAGRDEIRLAELRDERWIAGLRDGLIRRACATEGFEPRLAFQTADPLATRALVAAGLGVTLMPALSARDATPGVRALPIGPTRPAPRRTVFAVAPAGGRRPAVVARALDALAEAAQSASVGP
jgi:molybdate transport repressor ModE-like protein